MTTIDAQRTRLTAGDVVALAASEQATHVLALDATTSVFYRRDGLGRVEFAAATLGPDGWTLGAWLFRTVPQIPVSAGRVAA